MTNNLNEQLEQTNTTETVIENQQPLPTEVIVETPAPPTPTKKEKFAQKYPNLWKYITTGVLSFIAGMLVFSFASSLKQNHKFDRAREEVGQQMPMKSGKGQRQMPTNNQQSQPTQPAQSTQSPTTEKTV